MRGVARILDVTPPRNSNHCVCYCDDCQAFIHVAAVSRAIIAADDVLDDQGGTHVLHLSPARVSFAAGVEHVALMRLSAKGMLRWYSSCCGTPIGNTLTTAAIPFMALTDAFVHEPPAALGPIRGRSFPESAKGGRAAVPRDGLPMPFMVARVMFLMLSWRLRGDHRRSPLFDTATGQPRAAARVLEAPEREELRRRCAAWRS